MLAAAVTLAVFGLILAMVVDVMRRDGAKIMAALDGRSWTAQPAAGRRVTIHFSPRDRAAEPVRMPAGLRAAA